MNYDAILFDVGDTLIGYEPSQTETYLARFSQLSAFPLPPDAEERVTEALKAAEYAQLMKEHLGAARMPDDEFLGMLDTAALEGVFPNPAELLPVLQALPCDRPKRMVKPETFPVLDELRRRGQRMGIVSNYPPELRDYLQRVGLAPYFEAIIISGVVGVEKPDPRIMELAMKEMRVQPEHCLYVGDHPFDVLCARKAGMDVAWITGDKTRLPSGIDERETFRIRDLNDLLRL